MLQENTGKPLLLIFPFGYLSHYLRCLVLARHLRKYFTVLFAGDAAYNSYLTAEGFDTFPCQAIDAKQALAAIQAFDFSWLNETSMEAVFKEQVRMIRLLKPAAVLGDAVPTLKMAAQVTGVIHLSVINGYMTKYYAAKRTLSRTHPAYKLVKRLPARIAAMVTEQGEAFGFRTVHKPFKRLRQQYQLPAADYYLDEMEGDFNLISDLPSLFPQLNPPDNYQVIAPLFYTAIGTLDQKITYRPAERKTIFVSMGSTGSWPEVAFLNHPEFQKYRIIVAGDHERFLAGPHIEHLVFADATQLYPQVDLVICHGGNGSIYQALAFGIPVLCQPAHFEQEWNVDAITRAGLGQNLAQFRDIKELSSLVSKWIIKRESPLHQQFQQSIAQAQERLPHALETLAHEVIAAAARSSKSSLKELITN